MFALLFWTRSLGHRGELAIGAGSDVNGGCLALEGGNTANGGGFVDNGDSSSEMRDSSRPRVFQPA
ncbi:MAG: hypothetical protein WBZ36_07625 [Candidatus Nitrosopolaris sp.]